MTWYCANCGRNVAQVQIELDAECNVVCLPCYLADPPAEDVEGALHDIQCRLNG